MIKGRQSIQFEEAPFIEEAASIVGKKESEGPLGKWFENVEEDPMIGMSSWEEAESELQRKTTQMLLHKQKMEEKDIRYVLAGDLQEQTTASTFGLKEFQIPIFGLYGACSTMGESLALASMLVAAGYGDHMLAIASSHFGSAEKEFRFPLDYGNQRPLSATWTVTGCGAILVGKKRSKVRVTGVTPGRIMDYGMKDSMNMGACMAPAAADTIMQNFLDFGRTPEDYDAIFTGDLGSVGHDILLRLMAEKGYDLSTKHKDCGMMIYDSETQDTHAGGSGCGCAAVTLASYLIPQLSSGFFKRILFVPTGAMLSKVSFNEGRTVPGIAHGVVLEHVS